MTKFSSIFMAASLFFSVGAGVAQASTGTNGVEPAGPSPLAYQVNADAIRRLEDARVHVSPNRSIQDLWTGAVPSAYGGATAHGLSVGESSGSSKALKIQQARLVVQPNQSIQDFWTGRIH